MDSHLLQLWKPKAGLERRWQRQRWNTTFRRRLTQLNKETEMHAATLSRQNWGSLCNRLEHNMSLRQTWNLFRHLIDSTQSKTHEKQIMTKLIHASEAPPQELLQTLRAGAYLAAVGPIHSRTKTPEAPSIPLATEDTPACRPEEAGEQVCVTDVNGPSDRHGAPTW
ncbi:hypothetical protein HPB49_026645 [Dermacentor silvarum]|nr:hypothetical protein HPB49_026645 [Dermacentor silvarum]